MAAPSSRWAARSTSTRRRSCASASPSLVDEGHYDLIIDMEQVEFLDSTGLGVLVGGLKRVRTHEGSLRLVCTQERLLKIFRITGLTKVFAIHGSQAEAHGPVSTDRWPRPLRPQGDVTIAIARDPALVRTVRLVAAAVARRAACEDSLIEEIRLAVGEACARHDRLRGRPRLAPADRAGPRCASRPPTATSSEVTVAGRVDDARQRIRRRRRRPLGAPARACPTTSSSPRSTAITTRSPMSWPL